jgi:hypothetical protein
MTKQVGEVFYCDRDRCYYKVIGTDPTKPNPGKTKWRTLVRKWNPNTEKTEGPQMPYEEEK